MTSKIILSFLLVSLSFHVAADTLDSLRTEKIKGKKFIVHRAEPKETLYAISKRYNVSVEDLYKHNDSLEDGLKMYQEIFVPYSKKKKKSKDEAESSKNSIHIVKKGETLFAISRQYSISVDTLTSLNNLQSLNLSIGDTLFVVNETNNTITSVKTEKIDSLQTVHIVVASETLFSISRKYQVEIQQIQTWNGLSDYNISIGQNLIVGSSDNIIPETSADTVYIKSPVEKTPSNDTLYVKTDTTQFKTKTNGVGDDTRIIEEGFAMPIADTGYTNRYLVLHRKAPIGEAILIKNQMTNKTIEAIVVGRLPKNGINKTLLLRLSEAAFEAMGGIDLKIPIMASYVRD
jgi:LysM repeat protein